MTRTPTATDRLRHAIVTGRLGPGERLVELQLTEMLDAGRGAVRSALVELEKEGLVIREANRGATVRRVSLAEAIQITEARSALESLVAARAATRATPADRRELQDLVTEMGRTVEAADHARYSELNSLLHAALRRISDHTVANELVANLRDRAAGHEYRLALMPGRPEHSLQQHRAIVAAVTAADPEAAATAMAEHLASVIDVLRHWAQIEQKAV
ncbi:MAG TPA: GntR family transcriptional regulator [Acidimicrobiales bacterium]|nr:GntR family transcriptional regulator [Acidimicrobiales bacterium]